tara:strand:+ start:833 stop:988 length:156 start_codon:yes stop_codon:yes gene_type:complete
VQLPCDVMTDTLTDDQLDALADEAEAQERADAFLARLEIEREARVAGDFAI